MNEEYIKVSNEITDLTSKLTIAQNNLPGYNSRANAAVSDAQSTSVKSSEQASKAINGDVGDARKAKKNARKALKDAKNARHAGNNVKDQEKKIATLGSQLQKKQERLKELEEMRTTIRNFKQ